MVHLSSQAEADLEAFEEFVRKQPLVRECWMLSGEIDFILKCVAPDLKTFQAFVAELTAAPHVRNVKTSLTLRNSKDAAMVPLELKAERILGIPMSRSCPKTAATDQPEVVIDAEGLYRRGRGLCRRPHRRGGPVVEALARCDGPRFIMFETLAERTLALSQLERRSHPARGFNPKLERFIGPILARCLRDKIGSSATSAPPIRAARGERIVALAREQGLAAAAGRGGRRR